MRYGVVVLLGILGGLIFWLSVSSYSIASANAEADAFDRLRAGEGVTTTGTMTGTTERRQAARRRMVIVQCAVYTYPDGGGKGTLTHGCARDPDDLPELGSTVPVIYDPEGYAAFVNTDETGERLDSARATAPWYQWGGLALAVLCGSVVLWSVVRGFVRLLRGTPST
ncbi:DUF3592 domain-containing protein [Mumia qirimensis]|uniref:DUF3592 domain-containing protein n=1 Tax=Mumia qirimensis TaxID=3234852 RepID=UPI00351CE2EC